MSEHVHEWTLADHKVYDFRCRICGARMTVGAALAYINAAEQLSAQSALIAARGMGLIGLKQTDLPEVRAELRDYAKARGE